MSMEAVSPFAHFGNVIDYQISLDTFGSDWQWITLPIFGYVKLADADQLADPLSECESIANRNLWNPCTSERHRV